MPMKEKNEIVRNMHYAVLIIWMPDLKNQKENGKKHLGYKKKGQNETTNN